jgi:hypothetical protein
MKHTWCKPSGLTAQYRSLACSHGLVLTLTTAAQDRSSSMRHDTAGVIVWVHVTVGEAATAAAIALAGCQQQNNLGHVSAQGPATTASAGSGTDSHTAPQAEARLPAKSSLSLPVSTCRQLLNDSCSCGRTALGGALIGCRQRSKREGCAMPQVATRQALLPACQAQKLTPPP